MIVLLDLVVLFVVKVLDNALGTAKTILIQKNKSFLAAVALAVSNFLYFKLTKNVVAMEGDLGLYIIAIASGVGCWLAVGFDNKFSKDKTHVNVIMSDNLEEMKLFRDFLALNKITNVASDTYTKDWSKKTLTITAYAETKAQSKLIDEYIKSREVKFKRVIQPQVK